MCADKGAMALNKNKISPIQAFMKGEATAGLVLMAAAASALMAANSPWAGSYTAFFETPVLSMSLLHWINDGLMAVFFFLVGLEIKREVVGGELSTRAKAALPVLAAAGGMIGPAVIYTVINWNNPADLRGWAIPTATDIAFALGIIALLGSRVPTALKIFLTALAVIDDLGAIMIIALFYTADISMVALGIAVVCVIAMVLLNRGGVRRIDVYVVIGLILWAAVLKSGVHATMAGVLTALCIPATADDKGNSPLLKLEHFLHPYVTFLILPVFAFANAGVSVGDLTAEALTHPVTLGIVLGLFLGKQIGVIGISYAARAMGWVQLPAGVNTRQFYGVALLTGVGFTMSLFIGNLAFVGPERLSEVKIGVLAGSLLSGIVGYVILRFGGQPRAE
jgi:NhaA family Na+:H+ antiporter